MSWVILDDDDDDAGAMPPIDTPLLSMAERILPGFRKDVLPIAWEPRGILSSEGLAVCAMCDLFGVDVLIESGVYNGRSTQMWARHLGPGRVIGIDWEIRARAVQRLGQQVILQRGDANKLLPALIDQLADRRLGIFIDGPKGAAAAELAGRCIAPPNVGFVGIHDMSRRYGEGRELCTWLTDAPWWWRPYCHLDVDDSHWDEQQGTRWSPFTRHEKGKPHVDLGSYGYTIGFVCRDPGAF
jgi:hypothetical protein